MTVEFIYPTLLSSIPPSPERKVENTVQHDLIQTQVHEVADRSASSVAHKNNRSLTSSHASTEFDVNDLAILKSKYDTIVEYTVHLTAERDMIVTQLEVLKREYNNEINKTKKNKNSASSKNKEQDMESKRPQVCYVYMSL